MDLEYRYAILNDVDNLERLSRKCFRKFEMEKDGLKYDIEHVRYKLRNFINNSNTDILVALSNNEIKGFIVFAIVDSYYSDSKIFTEIAIQADPDLGKVTQSRVMVNIMKYVEKYIKQYEIPFCTYTITKKYDISNYLERQGFELSDKIYVKGR